MQRAAPIPKQTHTRNTPPPTPHAMAFPPRKDPESLGRHTDGGRRYPDIRMASRGSPSRKALGMDKSCPGQGASLSDGGGISGNCLRQGPSASGPHIPASGAPTPYIWSLLSHIWGSHPTSRAHTAASGPTPLRLESHTSGTFRSGQFPCPPEYSETFCAREGCPCAERARRSTVTEPSLCGPDPTAASSSPRDASVSYLHSRTVTWPTW